MKAQRAPEPAETTELDPAIGTLLREAAHYDLAAESALNAQNTVQGKIDQILRQMRPLEDALSAARSRLRDVGVELEAANTAALKQRAGAYDLGQMRGVPQVLMDAANQSAKTAAAAPTTVQQPQDVPAEQAAWEPRTCRCNQPLAWYPDKNDGVHTETGARQCNPGSGDGNFAEPVPVGDPLGQNGRAPAPADGAPR